MLTRILLSAARLCPRDVSDQLEQFSPCKDLERAHALICSAQHEISIISRTGGVLGSASDEAQNSVMSGRPLSLCPLPGIPALECVS